jgi:flagellar hook-associated protein 1 FlgK
MSGITNAINTALSGLDLFEAGIATVSNNLANVSTSGYAAETVTSLAAAGAAGQPGDGVQAPQILRAASGFAAALLRAANSASAAAAAQSTNLTTLSSALTNNGDVQTAINQFFDDVSTLAADPSSTAQRQTVLADAQTIVSTFQSAAGTIGGVVNSASQTLTQNVTSANGLLEQLAVINTSLGQAPGDPSLLDQQQAALNSLSSLIPVTAIPQTDGSVILASGGTILLDQSGAQTLTATPASATTAPAVTAGASATAVTLTAADGAIGSSIAAWNAATTASTGLNAIAAIFASSVNTVQAEGLTATGAAGGALFSVPSPTVTASAGNTGTATIIAQITTPSALPADGGPFLLSYATSTGWTATDQASGAAIPVTGSPPSFAGLTTTIAGAPFNGDSFIVNPAPNAATGIAVATTNADAIAAADPYVATPGALQSDGSILNNNAGTITAGTDSVSSAPAADAATVPASAYGASLLLTFTSATAYSIATTAAPGTPIANGTFSTAGGGNIAVAYPAGAAAGLYWQLPITGTPVAGDALTLTPGSTSSGSNATRLAASWTADGTTTAGTLQGAIVDFGTSLGANAQQAQQLATATASQVTTANSNLQTLAGVSSDQQAVDLTNYQQAYQAAAQVINAAHTMFESLLTAV